MTTLWSHYIHYSSVLLGRGEWASQDGKVTNTGQVQRSAEDILVIPEDTSSSFEEELSGGDKDLLSSDCPVITELESVGKKLAGQDHELTLSQHVQASCSLWLKVICQL